MATRNAERAGPAAGPAVRPLGLLRSLRRRAGLIASVCLIGTGLAGMAGLLATPTYTGTATVAVVPATSGGDRLADPAALAAQVDRLRSRTFLAEVVDGLKLPDPPAEGGLLAGIRSAWRELLRSLPGEWPAVAAGLAREQPGGAGRDEALAAFAGGLRVSSEAGSSLIGISYTSPARTEAALVANRIAELHVAQQPDTARIVARAAPPAAANPPDALTVAAAGFTISLALGALLALLRERAAGGRRQHAIRSAREVEAVLGLPTLALVPRLERLETGERAHRRLREEPDGAYARAVRQVLHALTAGAEARVLLVTSSLPTEGKTTFAVSLAALAAQEGRKVLLIDLDLRRPSVLRELGGGDGEAVPTGIVEHLTDKRPLAEAIRHDPASGLDYLPVRRRTEDPAELIESAGMRGLLETCRARYELVVLDTAPVASVLDTRAAAPLADRVVFVVRWGDPTVASAARDGMAALRAAGVQPAGAVLTQVDPRRLFRAGTESG